MHGWLACGSIPNRVGILAPFPPAHSSAVEFSDAIGWLMSNKYVILKTATPCRNKRVRDTVDTPPYTKKYKKSKICEKIVQRHNQNIWSNFVFCFCETCFFENGKNHGFCAVTKPRDHSKSIGHRILLLVRGLKPQTDLLQSPNMKFHLFLSSWDQFRVACWPHPHIVADIWLLKKTK